MVFMIISSMSMPLSDTQLPPHHDDKDAGLSGLPHLHSYWSRLMAARTGQATGHNPDYHRDRLLLSTLGLGLEQTMQYVLQNAPDFASFTAWITATAGQPELADIQRWQALYQGAAMPDKILRLHQQIATMPEVLSEADMQHWEEHGYVVLHEAVPAADCAAAAQVIWEQLGAREDDVESWYHGQHANIMVQLFQSAAFDKNRRSLRIHKAFSQLWGTADLWLTIDRCGFNVPERPGHQFRGPDLHWDMSLQQPIPMATQGILYLTDTLAEQGALTLVPGFQHRIDDWLAQLPAHAEPREQDLHALGSIPIAGKAGDLIIWQQALPHGSRPNLAKKPRIVQYVNMLPGELLIHETWR